MPLESLQPSRWPLPPQRHRRLSSTILIGAMLVSLSLLAHAATPGEVFLKNSPSIVVVVTLDSNGVAVGLGSGIVVAPRRVATNWHVIDGASLVVVRQSGISHSAAPVLVRRDRDLAILEVEGLRSPAVQFAPQDYLKVGDTVFAIGAPSGLELSLSQGIVSGLRTVAVGELIQTTVPISPGSSGGGLFDIEGKLVGMTTLKLAGPHAENLNFAVPANWLNDLAKSHGGSAAPIASGGTSGRAYLILVILMGVLMAAVVYLVAIRPRQRRSEYFHNDSLSHSRHVERPLSSSRTDLDSGTNRHVFDSVARQREADEAWRLAVMRGDGLPATTAARTTPIDTTLVSQPLSSAKRGRLISSLITLIAILCLLLISMLAVVASRVAD